MKRIAMVALLALALMAMSSAAFAAGPTGGGTGGGYKPLPKPLPSYQCYGSGYVVGFYGATGDYDGVGKLYNFVLLYDPAADKKESGADMYADVYTVSTDPSLSLPSIGLLGMLQTAYNTGDYVHVLTKSSVKCGKEAVRGIFAVSYYDRYYDYIGGRGKE